MKNARKKATTNQKKILSRGTKGAQEKHALKMVGEKDTLLFTQLTIKSVKQQVLCIYSTRLQREEKLPKDAAVATSLVEKKSMACDKRLRIIFTNSTNSAISVHSKETVTVV